VLTNITVDSPSRYYWNRYSFPFVTDPITLRTKFEEYGADSPLTTIQFKNLKRHAYDKWIYATFGGSRKWAWISRPDYYRTSWGRELDRLDREYDEQLENLGTVVYESPELRVRQITLEELDRLQRSRISRAEVTTIDFEKPWAEPYKVSGFTSCQGDAEILPCHAILHARVPGREIFTLQGFEHVPTAPEIHTSDLLVPIRRRDPIAIRAHVSSTLALPWGLEQTLTLKVNGRAIASRTFTLHDGVVVLEGAVPPGALTDDDLQRITFEFERRNLDYLAARLHLLEIVPASQPR
jgi:hypothetical protein